MPVKSIICRSQTFTSDAKTAIDELLAGATPKAGIHFLFASSGYDLEQFGLRLKGGCKGTVVGFTTSGHIGPKGFERAGAALLSLCGPQTRHWTWAINDLTHPHAELTKIRDEILAMKLPLDSQKTFGVVLVDGIHGEQERLNWALSLVLPDISIIGASPQESPLQDTYILYDGSFCHNVATFTLVTTDVPFSVFSLQRHQPTETRLGITRSNPENQQVFEIDGVPAAEAYADALGVHRDELNAALFAKYPLMVKAQDRYFVRTPVAVNPDGSLMFLCGLEQGTVVRMGKLKNELKSLKRELHDVSVELGGTQAVLAVDCVFTRHEHECHGLDAGTSEFISENGLVGSSVVETHGQASHRSHTLVGVAFGAGVGRRIA